MAGSYRHVTNPDGSFRGFDLLDNRRDDGEAIDEMWQMIAWFGRQLAPDDPRRAIHQAWLEGYLRPRQPGNASNEDIAGFDRFWEGDLPQLPDHVDVAAEQIDHLLRVDNTRLREMLGMGAGEGDWVIRLTHGGPTEEKTAHAKSVISAPQAYAHRDIFWEILQYELERMVRSIDALEGKPPRDRRKREPDINSVMQDDMAELLRALGLGDHARPISPHEVMVQQVIPAVKALAAIVDGYKGLERLRR